MFELTSAQYRFRQAASEGDLYEALGLAPTASSLDVDVAGARLAEQMPSMAQEISRVVNVLTHRRRKTLYGAVRKVRDEAADLLASRYSPELCRSIPDFRRDLWERCCRLFRFDLANEEQKLGDNGRQALVQAGPSWIVRDLLDACVNRLNIVERERKAGRARRDVWHARCRCRDSSRLFFTLRGLPTPQDGSESDPPDRFNIADYVNGLATCPRCQQMYQPTHFDDRYEFAVSAGLAWGDLIRGEPVWGGSPAFVVVGSADGPQAPKGLLERFLALRNDGKDVTLEEAEMDMWKRPPPAARSRRPSKRSWTERVRRRASWAAFAVIIGGIVSAISHQDSPQRQPPMPPWPPSTIKMPDSTPRPDWLPSGLKMPDVTSDPPIPRSQWPLPRASAPTPLP